MAYDPVPEIILADEEISGCIEFHMKALPAWFFGLFAVAVVDVRFKVAKANLAEQINVWKRNLMVEAL